MNFTSEEAPPVVAVSGVWCVVGRRDGHGMRCHEASDDAEMPTLGYYTNTRNLAIMADDDDEPCTSLERTLSSPPLERPRKVLFCTYLHLQAREHLCRIHPAHCRESQFFSLWQLEFFQEASQSDLNYKIESHNVLCLSRPSTLPSWTPPAGR